MVVADRLIEACHNIKQIFWEKLLKSKQLSSKSYDTLQTAVLDELVIAKLERYVQAICNSISNRLSNDTICV